MDLTLRRLARLLPALLCAAALLAACGGGGGGGGPIPGSDEWVDEQADAIAKQAAADLRTALKGVDRCSPTAQQIAAVYDALGRLQATGHDTDAVDRDVAAGVAPAARAIARAVARGENVGYDGPRADALAKSAGIDTRQSGWMDDPECEKRWTAVVEMVSVSQVPGVAASRVVTASVPLEQDRTGTLTGTADAKVVASMQPVPPCTFQFADASMPFTVRGKRVGETFNLTLSHPAVTTTGQAACELPTGTISTPTPIPWDALADFPITVLAKGGEQGTDPTGTVKVTLLTRR